MPRDPNRPVPGVWLRPDPEDHKSRTGKPRRDGYTVLERRPRTRYYDEPLPLDRATELERIYDDMPSMDGY